MKNPAKASAEGATSADVSDDAFLGGRIRLLQPRRGYRAGIDAVLLAAAVPEDLRGASGNTLLDAGAGIGTVGLCAARRLCELRVTLIEREPQLVDLARENIARNELGDRACVHLTDLTVHGNGPLSCQLAPESYAVVVANPPFIAARDGTMSEFPLKRSSHALRPQETLDQWCRFLARMCAPGGLAIVIHTTEGLDDIMTGFKGRFGGLIIQPLHPRHGEAANRVIVAARKGQRVRTRILPGIEIHAEGHDFTPRIAAVLRDGAGLRLPF
ncbi:MAG: hypothetical protein APF80_08930 [Alphaproteobacteria bacterium BRH_c36]|nr:MAG: hypothetical protein APF80_08930 [Alphaproteobacteria bacterium BRH_c36]